MTRHDGFQLLSLMRENLLVLVFDELHTDRGRQGADVAMLIGWIREMSANRLLCIGTSATMVSGGSETERGERVAEVASPFEERSEGPTMARLAMHADECEPRYPDPFVGPRSASSPSTSDAPAPISPRTSSASDVSPAMAWLITRSATASR
jgi:hypothetical protein